MRYVLVISCVCAFAPTASASDYFVVDHASYGSASDMRLVRLPAVGWMASPFPASHSVDAAETNDAAEFLERQPFGEPWVEDQPLEDHQPCDFCQPGHHNTGFLDFNSYWDTRDSVTTTVNAGANLKNGFQYFQLLNLDSPFGSGSYDWTEFYTEVNLRRSVWRDNEHLRHLDWVVQYADGNTTRGVLRAGIRWRMHDTPGAIGSFFQDVLKLKYNIAFHMIETDGTGWQMEHTYRRTFFENRLYIAAFVDHHINDDCSNSDWVTEHQVGVRLHDQWYFVAEYRYKSFAPAGSKSGLGIGLEYVMKFD